LVNLNTDKLLLSREEKYRKMGVVLEPVV